MAAARRPVKGDILPPQKNKRANKGERAGKASPRGARLRMPDVMPDVIDIAGWRARAVNFVSNFGQKGLQAIAAMGRHSEVYISHAGRRIAQMLAMLFYRLAVACLILTVLALLGFVAYQFGPRAPQLLAILDDGVGRLKASDEAAEVTKEAAISAPDQAAENIATPPPIDFTLPRVSIFDKAVDAVGSNLGAGLAAAPKPPDLSAFSELSDGQGKKLAAIPLMALLLRAEAGQPFEAALARAFKRGWIDRAVYEALALYAAEGLPSTGLLAALYEQFRMTRASRQVLAAIEDVDTDTAGDTGAVPALFVFLKRIGGDWVHLSRLPDAAVLAREAEYQTLDRLVMAGDLREADRLADKLLATVSPPALGALSPPRRLLEAHAYQLDTYEALTAWREAARAKLETQSILAAFRQQILRMAGQ